MTKPILDIIVGVCAEVPVFVDVFHSQWAWNSHNYPLHYHSECEIHLVNRGHGTYFISDTQYQFARSHLVVIQPFVVHRLVVPGDTAVDKLGLMFNPEFLGDRPQVASVFSDLPVMMSMRDDEAAWLNLLLLSIEGELKRKDDCWRDIALTALELIGQVARRLAIRQPVSRPQHPAIRRVIEHINRHFKEDLPLNLLADVAGLSPSYLSSLFTKATGIHIKQYIAEMRVAEARRMLLEEPDLRVTDIALTVGFNELADLDRAFKRIVGLTPTFYRKIFQTSGK